jgi:hypothetical protein
VVTVSGAAIDDGACGAAIGIPASSAPTANLCAFGYRFGHERRRALVVELLRSRQYRAMFGANCRGWRAHNHRFSRAVAPGGLETVTIQNGPGNTTDWVGLY